MDNKRGCGISGYHVRWAVGYPLRYMYLAEHAAVILIWHTPWGAGRQDNSDAWVGCHIEQKHAALGKGMLQSSQSLGLWCFIEPQDAGC